MLTAFTMIQARPDAIKRVAQAIASLPHVNEVYSVTGEWDIIAIVRLQDYEQLAEVIPDEFHDGTPPRRRQVVVVELGAVDSHPTNPRRTRVRVDARLVARLRVKLDAL
jgi:DNA-binding Lrp family transcriptional regulator